MTQYPASYGPPAGAAPHQVVHVIAKPGGFWRGVAIVSALFLFAIVFCLGLVFGIIGMAAGAAMDGLVVQHTYRDGDSSNMIATIPVEGVIDDRQADYVRAAVDHILENKRRIRAVILRVNSPGGGVTASDQIWYEIKRLKDHNLPVIASYGGVAASGGYYISCGADHIMAQETCITGSIGVIAQILTLEGLMDKVGVQPVTLVATASPEKSVANDVFRSWNENDKTKIRTMLDAAYDVFNRRVRDGRKAVIADPSLINALANGSIYTAQEAKENGLIDSIGYFDDAIALTETRAGITTGRAKVVTLHRPPSVMETLLARDRHAVGADSFNADSIRGLVNDLAMPRAMYLMH